MPHGSIPHDTQRPDSNKRHQKRQENRGESFESIMERRGRPKLGLVLFRANIDPRLTDFQLRVYSTMCGYSNNETHICWPKQKTLADLLHTSVSQISQSIARLAELGYVEIEKIGFPARNIYKIPWEIPGNSDMSRENIFPNVGEPEAEAAETCLPATEFSVGETQTLAQGKHRLYPGLKSYNIPIEQPSKSLRTLRDLHDDGEETRVPARASRAENILEAGGLPRQTSRAALAQLIANHPQISEGEWIVQAAAAAAWYAEHDRRLHLGNLASWITRYLREQQQLQQLIPPPAAQEQEHPHGRSSQHQRPHGARRSAAQPRSVSADLRYPAGPDTTADDTIPDDANEEELVEQYRRANSERRRAEQAERQARLN